MPSHPPYALDVPAFPLRALALLAGRAPLGGPRETALATLVAARLTAAAAPPPSLPAHLRAARAEAARAWMSSVALQAQVRSALVRLVAATSADDLRGVGPALAKVTDITAPQLDRAARLELERLAARFEP